MTAPAHDPYAALRIPDFRRFILFLLTQTFATMIVAVVVGWQLYDVTRDPLALGLVGLAEAIPFIGFAWYVDTQTAKRHWEVVRYYLLTMACDLAQRLDDELLERSGEIEWRSSESMTSLVLEEDKDAAATAVVRGSFDDFVRKSGQYGAQK